MSDDGGPIMARFVQKHYVGIYTILVIAAAIMYVLLIGKTDLLSDEAYSLNMMRHDIADICAITAADVHPPLYYILLKMALWPFGYSVMAGRIFSIIPMVLLLIFAGIKLKTIWGNCGFPIIYALLVLLSPKLPEYAIQIRMYSWAALFVFLALIYGYEYINNGDKKNLIVFVISSVCAAYTHYFALVSVGIIYAIYTIIIISNKEWDKLKKILISIAGSVIAYLPWLRSFVTQLKIKVDYEYWIPEVTMETVLAYPEELFGINEIKSFNMIFALIVIGMLIILMIHRSGRLAKISVIAIGVFVGTIAVGVLASVIVRPVFISRYAIPVVPIFLLFVAAGIASIKNYAIAFALTGYLFVCGVFSYIDTIEWMYNENGVVDEAFVEAYDECEAYYVTTSKGAHCTNLAWYDASKPIFYYYGIDASTPVRNMYDHDEFDADIYECVLLFVDEGKGIPEDLEQIYESKYQTTVVANASSADVYLLEK